MKKQIKQNETIKAATLTLELRKIRSGIKAGLSEDCYVKSLIVV
jgi:hypothetical protein